jgi:hypothetical protein
MLCWRLTLFVCGRKEKLSRLLEAFVFAIANTSKTIYVSMIGLAQREQNTDSTNKTEEK